MSAVTFDTLATARTLREKGATQDLAEAIADAIRISKDTDFSHLSTKEELNTFKSELKADLLRLEVKIAEVHTKIVIWMFGGFVSMGGLLAAILFKMH